MGEISDALKRARKSMSPGGSTAAAPRATSTFRDALREEPVPEPDESPEVAIPHEPAAVGVGRTVLVDPRGPISEHYRHFAIRLNRALKQANARSVVITSATRAEGKTTTSCNLALALASMAGGRQIALLELDVRRPSLAFELGVRPRAGIQQVLAGEIPLAEARLKTDVPDLDVYLATAPDPQPLDHLSGPAVGAVFRELTRRHDLVVVDSPPVLPVPDVPLILAHADAAVAVARAGVTRRAAFEAMLAMLGREKMVGVFLNQAGVPRHSRFYGYYSYDAATGDGVESKAPVVAGEEPAT